MNLNNVSNVQRLIMAFVLLALLLHAQEPPVAQSQLAPGLTAAESQQVDDLIGPFELTGSLRLRLEALPEHIEELARRESRWQGEEPAMKAAGVARAFREQGLLVPDLIDSRVIDDIVWHYDHPYGTGTTRANYRQSCAAALGFIGDRRGVPTIKRAVKEVPGIPVWQGVAWCPDERLIPEISDYLSRGGDQNLTGIVRSLSELGDASLPLFRLMLETEVPRYGERHVHEVMVGALARIGTEGALELLQDLAASIEQGGGLRAQVDWEVRALEASLHDRIWVPYRLAPGERRSLERLAARLLHTERGTLEPEAERLFVALGEKGLPILRPWLSSERHADGPGGPHWIHTPLAADLMVRIGEPAVPCLIHALLDRRSHVRRAAAEALGEIIRQELPPTYEFWAEWWKSR